jgi:DNA replicative helicase MCM subunit Mcm2 (Cdc46/Mcm family)
LSEEAVEKISKIFVKARMPTNSGGATVNFRWGAALTRLACAAAKLDLSGKVLERHVDFAHQVLNESLTTTDPDMVIEGGSGLSKEQTKRFEDFKFHVDEYFKSRKTAVGDRDGLYAFVKEHWKVDPVDNPAPTESDMALWLSRWETESEPGVKVAPKRIEYMLL